MERIKVGGIMQSDGRGAVKVMSCPDRADIVGLVLGALGERNINLSYAVMKWLQRPFNRAVGSTHLLVWVSLPQL